MKWWKCEKCPSGPCYMANAKGLRTKYVEGNKTSPPCGAGEPNHTFWVECGPAPHEPTCKPTLQWENAHLKSRLKDATELLDDLMLKQTPPPQVEDDPLPHEPVKREGTIIGSPEATKILRDTVKKWEASEEGRDHMRRIKARFGLT